MTAAVHPLPRCVALVHIKWFDKAIDLTGTITRSYFFNETRQCWFGIVLAPLISLHILRKSCAKIH